MSDDQGCLGFLAGLFGGRPRDTGPLPYRLRDDFLSPAELSFYRVLSTAVAGEATVLTKVNLGDVFFVARPNENAGFRNRIARKHVDFLVCDGASMRPLIGVELDDRSHQRSNRQDRDRFVDQVFEVAGLPLLHVPVRSAYGVAELAASLEPHLRTRSGLPGADSSGAQSDAPADMGVDEPMTTPICPKCGEPMIVRTVSRGERRGEQFYGCRNYPRCRETVPHPRASG
jgi:predicted RNA-binding Zn-ribbon protein involved in translation (DUF1610 family)